MIGEVLSINNPKFIKNDQLFEFDTKVGRNNINKVLDFFRIFPPALYRTHLSMYKSKLIRFLSVFTVEEIKQLEHFIVSPLFNESKRPGKVQSLLQYLFKYHPQFEPQDVQRERVFQAVFPNEDFNNSKLSKLASESLKLIKHFIRVCCSNSEIGFNDLMAQIQFYQQRGLDIDFFYTLDHAQEYLDSIKQKDQTYFHNQFIIEAERTNHLIKLNDKKGNINLPAAIYNLDLYYIISKMEFCSYLLTRRISTKLDTQDSVVLLKPVLEAAKMYYLDVPIVSAYYHTYSLVLYPNNRSSEDFQLLKNVLRKQNDLIPKGALRTIHTCMRNYLANQYNNGVQNSLTDLFELFKDQLRLRTVYQDEKFILASTLQNAITVALKLNETDWAMNFLAQHKCRIKGADDPEDIYQFNLANILFHQGKYQEVLDTLEKFHFREMFYNLAARRLGIKLDYETELSLDVFEYRLKALKSFVYEQKKILSQDKYDSNNNFVKLLMQVYSILQEDYSRSFMNLEPKKERGMRINALIKKVKTEKTIAEREWLQEKLEELKSI